MIESLIYAFEFGIFIILLITSSNSIINYLETWKHYHSLHCFLDNKYSYLDIK